MATYVIEHGVANSTRLSRSDARTVAFCIAGVAKREGECLLRYHQDVYPVGMSWKKASALNWRAQKNIYRVVTALEKMGVQISLRWAEGTESQFDPPEYYVIKPK